MGHYPPALFREFYRHMEWAERPLVMPWVAQYERPLGRTFDVATVAETFGRPAALWD